MVANNHVHSPFEINEWCRGKEKVVNLLGVALPRFHGESTCEDSLIIFFFELRKGLF